MSNHEIGRARITRNIDRYYRATGYVHDNEAFDREHCCANRCESPEVHRREIKRRFGL